MVMALVKQLKTAFILLGLFIFITGIAYPLLITGIANVLFPWHAKGSLIELNGKTIGSQLIGQSFTAPSFFWGRPSATTPYPYNALNSMASNLGPINPDLIHSIKDRALFLRQQDPTNQSPVPIDLVTASGSGLDPDISILAALYQVPRIAKARHISQNDLLALINQYTKKRHLILWEESRVNVLQLNLALATLSTDARMNTDLSPR